MPARSGISERSVAKTALDLIDAEGLDGLSMRKLASVLGVSPMAVYTYFADRGALLEAATQLLYAQVDVPSDDTLGPEDTVRHVMRSVRRVILAHPNAVTLFTRYPPRTLDALAFVEAGYRSFRRTGISDRDTARAYRALVAYSIGTAETEINRYFEHHPAARMPAGSVDAPTLERHLPNVTEVGPLLDLLDDAEEFEYGLNLILDGFMHGLGAR
jgi:AcrR family transcriptional regulator